MIVETGRLERREPFIQPALIDMSLGPQIAADFDADFRRLNRPSFSIGLRESPTQYAENPRCHRSTVVAFHPFKSVSSVQIVSPNCFGLPERQSVRDPPAKTTSQERATMKDGRSFASLRMTG